jgi:dihydrofolate synthase/folylpolyglutamate synthase
VAFRDLEELFHYIESFTNLERSGSLFSSRSYQLERMKLLLAAFQQPQLRCRTLHIAGSKGKGSTAVLLARALQEAGFRTGLYTSPHVESYLERIEVLGEPPDVPLLLRLGEEIRRTVQGLPEHSMRSMGPPNTFELLTLLGFCYFRERACDWVVVETGIGGRLDATNLVSPELCLITPIELEHTDVLGDTLQAIASEKAGIIKPRVPVLCGRQPEPVRAVMRRVARERGSPLLLLDEELQSLQAACDREGTEVRVGLRGEPEVELRLALIGQRQGENAALAWLALRRCLEVPEEAVRLGFSRASLPGRMELLQRQPPLVADGAHTPRSVEAVLETFRELYGGGGVLLFAAAAGKRVAEMAEVLAEAFPAVVVTSPGSFRESHPEEVYREFLLRNPGTILEGDTGQALLKALSLAGESRPILVTGSFYLVGEVRSRLRRRLAQAGPGGTAGLY